MRHGATSRIWTVRLFVANNLDEAAQRLLEAFLDDNRLRIAIESDKTLGGAASDLFVRGDNGEQIFTTPDAVQMLGTDLTVEVLPK